MAASGAAVGGPWGAVIGGAFGAAADMSTPGGPSNASSLGTIGGHVFDNSGFNVSFGDASPITAERTQTESGQFDQYLPYVIVAAVFLVGWRAFKK